MTADTRTNGDAAGGSGDGSFRPLIAQALTDGGLPGEVDGLEGPTLDAAAAFAAATAATRQPGKPAIAVESVTGDAPRRLMRLAIVNDDMPFLVDSVAAVFAERGLGVVRLLHPVLTVRRDGEGKLATRIVDLPGG
jgi:glutamate dehydrogenase